MQIDQKKNGVEPANDNTAWIFYNVMFLFLKKKEENIQRDRDKLVNEIYKLRKLPTMNKLSRARALEWSFFYSCK